MGIFGFIEDNLREGECLIYGHEWEQGRCVRCGRKGY